MTPTEHLVDICMISSDCPFFRNICWSIWSLQFSLFFSQQFEHFLRFDLIYILTAVLFVVSCRPPQTICSCPSTHVSWKCIWKKRMVCKLLLFLCLSFFTCPTFSRWCPTSPLCVVGLLSVRQGQSTLHMGAVCWMYLEHRRQDCRSEDARVSRRLLRPCLNFFTHVSPK